MPPFKRKISVGTELYCDGEAHVVEGFSGATIHLRSRSGRTSRTTLASLVEAPDYRVITSDASGEASDATTWPDDVPEPALHGAQQILEHLLEARTGYRMGSAASALPGEPLPQFDPDSTTLTQRIDAKASELGRTARWLFKMQRRYDSLGIYGLVDQRVTAIHHDRVDHRIKEALEVVLDEITNLSNISHNQIARRTARKLKEKHPQAELSLPTKSTFNRLLQKLAQGRGTFGSAKARRSIANRPSSPYSHFIAHRPGEMVLIDSTPLDAYAMDPYSFRWVQIQLTIAYDIYSRSILAWRFTPVSTKAVDAALLLYDMVRPKLMQPGWPEAARWPYVGVPESIVIEMAGDGEPLNGLAGIPFIHPESVLVDRGRVFLSQAFTEGCTRLGINLFIARPYTPTDKSHVERLFRTIREAFIESLPAYKGPDIFSRGSKVESTAYYFLDEIDALFAEWVATYWQRRYHDGLELPCVPALHLSPNDMYEEGIARAGFVYLVPDDRLYYELLPTEWRTIQHYGVEVRGLRYDGEIIDDFRNQVSPFSGVHVGKWPIRYDPRDYSRVFFYDYTLDQWHSMPWVGCLDVPRPFNEATLSYAKSLVLARGGNPRNHDELRVMLNELLNRIDDETLTDRKERRLAAINAMHAQRADRDRPRDMKPVAPDDEGKNLPAGPLIRPLHLVHPDGSCDLAASDPPIFRTVDEAMEDDDDDLAL